MIHTAHPILRRFAILLGLSLLILPAKAEGPKVLILKATAYTSSVRETDATPFITATGARTRYGIIAVSRDLLQTDLPYGSLVKLEDLGRWEDGAEKGKYNPMLEGILFVVEDTMNRRKRQQIDIWMPDRALALKWGVRRVKLTIVRYGR
ncbi:3D domain-containing protein [Marinithermus hydrothermalis]|uniref:3D domain-containing protein n=1 Tax=Marinithermus hydrothermalis (strain DSM 14884 / JCM 11576 / T1) TaxID=869210 RepID=F2NN65_MARHT|nr:3D domain-containing protein [Marinithermus hydrothermalis]AEB12804.1 hypothetical protein Marky_2079 [Marinithermus hydrothermalis DSM 14884]